MKNLHLYLVGISILPLTLGIIIATFIEVIMIKVYFEMMIENISSQIVTQMNSVQKELLIQNRNLMSSEYFEIFREMLEARKIINLAETSNLSDDPSLKKTVVQYMNEAILSERFEGFDSSKPIYTHFPAGVEMKYATDYHTSTDHKKVGFAHATAILNGNLNVNNNFTRIKDWMKSPPYLDDMSRVLSVILTIPSFSENSFNITYDPNRNGNSITMIATPSGLYVTNFFNFEYVNEAVLNKNDCPPGIHTNFSGTILYDPRCRVWHVNCLNFSRRVLSDLRATNPDITLLNYTNNYYPFIISPPFAQAFSQSSMRFTLTLVNQFEDFSPLDYTQSKSFIISKDLYLEPFANLFSKTFAQTIFKYFDYMESNSANNAIKTALTDQFNDIQLGTIKTGNPKDYTAWVRQAILQTKETFRFYILYLNKNMDYEILVDGLTSYFFINLPTGTGAGQLDPKEKEFLVNFVSKDIKFNKDNLLKNFDTFKEFPMRQTDGTYVNKNVSISTVSMGIVEIEEEKYYEVMKFMVITPQYLVSDKYNNLIALMSLQIFYSAIISFGIVLVFIMGGLVVILLFAKKLTKHFNEVVELASNVEKGLQVVQDREDVNKNMNHEIGEVKTAFFNLNNIFNSDLVQSSNKSNQKESGSDLIDNDSNNILKYAFRIRLFTMLNDRKMIGILLNNLGNLRYNAGGYAEALGKYEESIQVLEMYYTSPGTVKPLSEDQYNQLKINRTMNQVMALKMHIECMPIKEYSKIEKLKSLLNEVFNNDKILDIEYGRQIRCLCMLSWISGLKDETLNAASNLAIAEKEKLSKNKPGMNPDMMFIYQQEIDYEKSKILCRQKKYNKALAILTNSMKRDLQFDMKMRVLQVKLLVELFNYLGLRHTPGIKELKVRFQDKTITKRYILALQYSGSMKYGNKIENGVKTILEIWENHIRKNDHVAFIRYNINPDVIFGLEEKQINQFSKRIEIEKSIKPRDRTSFYDAVYKSVCILKQNSDQYHNYVIIFGDGFDTSSVHTKEETIQLIHSGPDIAVIGIGLKVDGQTKRMMTEICQSSNRGSYIDIFEDKFDLLFQLVSQYANYRGHGELHYE